MIRFGKVVSDAHAIACDGGVGALKLAMCACGRRKPKRKPGLRFGKEETSSENKRRRLRRLVSSRSFLTHIGPYSLYTVR